MRVFKGISGARHRSRPSHHIIAVKRRQRRDDFKGRKVISEVISEHERENGK